MALVVQWLRLLTLNAGDPGSTPGQGTRTHIPQLRVWVPQLTILCVAAKTRHSRSNKYHYIKKKKKKSQVKFPGVAEAGRPG